MIVFCDDGVTGTHFDRPKFDELIEMARNQEIHCIMVKDLSRFGRNFLEMGNYLELILPLYGVRFISINDAFDTKECPDSNATANDKRDTGKGYPSCFS